MDAQELKKLIARGRTQVRAELGQRPPPAVPVGEPLDLVGLLQGSWVSTGQGWNLIALPFAQGRPPLRLLMNQYSETLQFALADTGIPNRGIEPEAAAGDEDQFINALGYTQRISQVDAADAPSTDLKGGAGKPIHFEPGLVLQTLNHVPTGPGGERLNLARLATIPHGDSVLAMGFAEQFEGPPTIGPENALPQRVPAALDSPYMAPYAHFEANRFRGTVPTSATGFPGFFASNANAILQFATPCGRVRRTTVLHFDTGFSSGGVLNIPFVTREANAAEMRATFWIMELEPSCPTLPPTFVMQYSQTVMLDFFDSPTEPGKKIRWPHVSINTLRRV